MKWLSQLKNPFGSTKGWLTPRNAIVAVILLVIVYAGRGRNSATAQPAFIPPVTPTQMLTTIDAASAMNGLPTQTGAATQGAGTGVTDVTVVYPGLTQAEAEMSAADWDLPDRGYLANYFLTKLLTQVGNTWTVSAMEVWGQGQSGSPGKVWCVYKALKADPNSSLSKAIADWSVKTGSTYPNLEHTYTITVPATTLDCVK